MNRPPRKGRGGAGEPERKADAPAVSRSRPPRIHPGRVFQHHQDVAVDSLYRLLLEPASSVMTWAVIGIALALPLCLSLLVSNLQQFGVGVDQAARITLYIEADVEASRTLALQAELSANENISDVEYISADQALAEFESRSGFGEVLAGLSDNPLPAVLVVTPASLGAGTMERLLAQMEGLPEVESAQLDLEWVQRLNSILALMQRLAAGLGVLLCLGVLLVIGNTIRLAIENRRSEIVVVKLVGGTDAYVARPFLYTGLWYGVGGGLIASVLMVLGLFLMQGPVTRLTGLYGSDFSLQGLDATGVLLLLAGSGLLGWLGAWISVLRHLRDIEPR